MQALTRATGYIADPVGYKRTPFGWLSARLGVGTLPDASSMAPFLPSVLDQGDTSSCTGGSTAAAIFTTLYANGAPLGWVPSPAGIYTIGRALDRVTDDTGQLPPLEDIGAEPNQVMRGISEFGVRPMRMQITSDGRYYDAEPANVNDEPKLGELETDARSLIVGEYGLHTVGQRRIDDLCGAICAKRCVTVGIAGGSAVFQSYAGGVLPALYAPIDHYVFLFGYETLPNGRRAFQGRNTWGTSWGEYGNFRLSEDAVQELRDVVVLDVAVKEAA